MSAGLVTSVGDVPVSETPGTSGTSGTSGKPEMVKKPMSNMTKCLWVLMIVILVIIIFMFTQEHLEQKNIVELPDVPKPLLSNWNLADGSGKVVTFAFNTVKLTPAQKVLFKGVSEVRGDVLRNTLMGYAKKQRMLRQDGKFVKLDPVLRRALGIKGNSQQVKTDAITNVAENMMIVYKLPGGSTNSVLVKHKRTFVNTQNGNVNVVFEQPAERKTLRFILKDNVLYSVGVSCAVTNPNCLTVFAKRA